MRAPRNALLLAVALLALVPASASAAGFSLGVMASDVRSTSAILWTRANDTGLVGLFVSRDKQFNNPTHVFAQQANPSRDNTIRRLVKGLRAGTTYYYRFLGAGGGGGKKSATGRFRTPPKTSANKTIRFAFSGDTDAQRAAGGDNIFYNDLKGNNGLGAENFGIYRQMVAENNHFNVNMGDTIYSDSEVPGKGALASSVSAKRAKYRMNLRVPALQKLRRSAGVYNQWDDHEFVNDFTPPEHGKQIYERGLKAFQEYMPVRYSGKVGLYARQRWGKNLELFRLDGRTFRSAKASANGTCDNPETGQPDLAPTLPQANRNLFALAIPSLSQPVSQQCKDRINSPNRTLIGVDQRRRFFREIKASKATFKVILNEVPIQQFYALPYDRWEGYEFERKLVLRTLEDAGVKNVVWLTTDTHGNLVNVVRYSTLETEQPVDSPYSEFVTGPVSTMTYRREIDQQTGEGNGNAIDTAAFDAPPPTGVGMSCSNIDVYSYAEVVVNSTSATITAKDVRGNVVLDQSDQTPCTLTIPKQ